MKYILLIIGMSYPPMWPAQGVPSYASVSYVKTFESKEACEATGLELAPPSRTHSAPATFKCVEERP